MLARVLVIGALLFFVVPLLLNVWFYFEEKELEESTHVYNAAETMAMKEGNEIYAARCAGCHGENGDGGGGYPRVNGKKQGKIYAMLLGYKNGTYGTTSKGVMTLQVQDLGEAQLEALASHLSSVTPRYEAPGPRKPEKTYSDQSFDSSS